MDFGFAPIETRSIDIDIFDSRILKYVIKYEPSLLVCLSCGGCTATCSAGNLTDFNVRRMQLMLRRGETENLQTEINKCMLCGKCLLVCPRGVNLRNVVMLIKKALVIYKNQEK
ncbi:MAG: 4Fe-4S dicluster domain-containing protein [Bacteroidales bacterium]|nr:4Fe-4S dicluster domain-containing protein [Bacteroidales bacterium]